jgi:hypothetical protein
MKTRGVGVAEEYTHHLLPCLSIYTIRYTVRTDRPTVYKIFYYVTAIGLVTVPTVIFMVAIHRHFA